MKIGAAEFDKLIEAAHFADMPEFLAALLEGKDGDVRISEGNAAGAVKISTMHGAKGLEFSAVFVCGLNENALPLTIGGETDEEEERRLFYVGMTRAKKELVLTAGGRPSPFTEELPDGVKREKAFERAQYQQVSMF